MSDKNDPISDSELQELLENLRPFVTALSERLLGELRALVWNEDLPKDTPETLKHALAIGSSSMLAGFFAFVINRACTDLTQDKVQQIHNFFYKAGLTKGEESWSEVKTAQAADILNTIFLAATSEDGPKYQA